MPLLNKLGPLEAVGEEFLTMACFLLIIQHNTAVIVMITTTKTLPTTTPTMASSDKLGELLLKSGVHDNTKSPAWALA